MLSPGDLVFVDIGPGHTDLAPEVRRLARLVSVDSDYTAIVDFGGRIDVDDVMEHWQRQRPEGQRPGPGLLRVSRRRLGKVRGQASGIGDAISVVLVGPGRVRIGGVLEIDAPYGKPAQMRRVG
jgi:hypothetical protein